MQLFKLEKAKEGHGTFYEVTMGEALLKLLDLTLSRYSGRNSLDFWILPSLWSQTAWNIKLLLVCSFCTVHWLDGSIGSVIKESCAGILTLRPGIPLFRSGGASGAPGMSPGIPC
jgi:hypothetical protein